MTKRSVCMHLTNDGVKRQYFLIKQAENAFLDKNCVELKHSFFYYM